MSDLLDALRSELDAISQDLDRQRELYNVAVREIAGRKMAPAEAEEYLARRMAELGGDEEPVDEGRLDELLDELADSYLDRGPRHRAAILDLVAERRSLRHQLLRYLHRCAQELTGSRDERWLLRGLAGAVIEDATTDWRDTRVGLAALYQAARKARIKPEPVFQRIALIAENESRGAMSTRNILATFDRRACEAAMPPDRRR